jgi:hypothetical protein
MLAKFADKTLDSAGVDGHNRGLGETAVKNGLLRTMQPWEVGSPPAKRSAGKF